MTIIGVDGGALPEHVRALSEAVQGCAGRAARDQGWRSRRKPPPRRAPDGGAEHGSCRILGKKFLVTVELDIPRGLDISSVLEGAAYLQRHGIDAVEHHRWSARTTADEPDHDQPSGPAGDRDGVYHPSCLPRPEYGRAAVGAARRACSRHPEHPCDHRRSGAHWRLSVRHLRLRCRCHRPDPRRRRG